MHITIWAIFVLRASRLSGYLGYVLNHGQGT